MPSVLTHAILPPESADRAPSPTQPPGSIPAPARSPGTSAPQWPHCLDRLPPRSSRLSPSVTSSHPVRAISSALGIAIPGHATAVIATYPGTEPDLGRTAADTDLNSLTPSQVGGSRLPAADRDPRPPSAAATNQLERP